jgi:hypothetical protein
VICRICFHFVIGPVRVLRRMCIAVWHLSVGYQSINLSVYGW